ncbi:MULTISPECIES: DUF2330 domain-containing protein [Bradyrhizobium]|jgi:hypothetical protein|uniref:DUF2330 domain-containing protein n=2 Tax=Bradyrhizobium TaxID=374 RepID=A0ABS5FYL5_9BRAD|nr:MULTISPECIES: DUF2330 domain-containing protein [Bradyrhizobium]ABQ39687.1 putative exported protein of unknown function [Bradyrhizobium sp. BTAi1]MBR1134145.1 DUF2330 domain-containing protein [Bradyrhizobium denitrificans]MDU1493776.1 DUF2330 domain-containing protein [Bradyrhizobium sp.]MDU1543931.1 DUF2330 domain-containing protein [Bradyrhizobium sp.]MDU1694330.1 DUF2330 domain-containing protein [Bradyrhizobium sp.]
MTLRIDKIFRTCVATAAILAHAAVVPANAFCGFYVAQADAKLFNKSSKVVLARDGEQTSITMASDFEGDVKEFAVVVPVPTFIERKQIGVVEPKTIDHLDSYTAPRLVEYHDEDPCHPIMYRMAPGAPMPSAVARGEASLSRQYGVTIEASYDVAEYDVLILSAQESDGLTRWLTDNDYRIPQGAEAVLGSYIRQGMRFFVAKVNVERMKAVGNGTLRPLQVRYQSAKFMVPLRLGTVNAAGPQDLIIYALTRSGRIEAANYRTVKIPTDIDVPLYVKNEFGPFYKAVFERAVARENMQAVFVEYAWDMGWCDPCAADPMSNKELAELGARWIGSSDDTAFSAVRRGGGSDAFVTRLHVRYDAKTFPEDIVFTETRDRSNFQGRYVQHHPWRGEAKCDAARSYQDRLTARFAKEATDLAALTGWPRSEIVAKMAQSGEGELK